MPGAGYTAVNGADLFPTVREMTCQHVTQASHMISEEVESDGENKQDAHTDVTGEGKRGRVSEWKASLKGKEVN